MLDAADYKGQIARKAQYGWGVVTALGAMPQQRIGAHKRLKKRE
jgi:hypothetical protein